MITDYKIPLAVLIFLILIVFSIAVQAQHYLRVNFSEPMDTLSLIPKINYTVFDNSMNEIEVLNTGLIEDVDSSVIVVIPFLNYKTNYVVRVTDVTDKAGNLINENNSAWFYFDGYNPDEPRPYLILK